MRISIEQLFYGRGDRGYGVLGTSPGGVLFAARVETLCGAVGTPGADYGGEPFLLSVPEGDRVLMICSRRGAPDSMGRETLFFHALVATKKDLLAAKADAFSLFAQGAFVAKIPSGPIDALPLEVKPGRDDSPSRPNGGRIVDASLPCVIRSDQAAPDAVRAVVNAKTIDLSWATFSFQPLVGFDVQVLPPRLSAPRTANEYDASGNLLRSAAQTRSTPPSQPIPDDVPSGRDGSTSRPTNGRVVPASPPSKTSPMLKLSFAANAALAVLCAALLASRKPSQGQSPDPPSRPRILTNTVERVVTKPSTAEPSEADRKKIQDEAVATYREQLEASFSQTFRIRDFDSESTVIPGLAEYAKEYENVRSFLEKLKHYVLFVNTNLPETPQP